MADGSCHMEAGCNRIRKHHACNEVLLENIKSDQKVIAFSNNSYDRLSLDAQA